MIINTELVNMIYWITEREAIRHKKEDLKLPWPWTTDNILKTYSFCNVRREDDRVTRWIKANIREPFADEPYLWWMLCAARQLNKEDTLQELISSGIGWPVAGGSFTLGGMTQVLENRARRGDIVWGNAYMIKAESNPKVGWYNWTKHKFIAEIVLGSLWRDSDKFTALFASNPTLEQAWELMYSHYGWGPFLSYQVVVDWRFTKGLLVNASDKFSWAAAGPGTIRGLNRFFGRAVDYPLAQSQALEQIRELYKQLEGIREKIPFDFSDVPNICCEYDKYQRIKNGEGRMKNKYKPPVVSSGFFG